MSGFECQTFEPGIECQTTESRTEWQTSESGFECQTSESVFDLLSDEQATTLLMSMDADTLLECGRWLFSSSTQLIEKTELFATQLYRPWDIPFFVQDLFPAVPAGLSTRGLEVSAQRDSLLHCGEADGACRVLRTRESGDEVRGVEGDGAKKVLSEQSAGRKWNSKSSENHTDRPELGQP